MSCEGNRGKFIAHVTQSNPGVASTFGGEEHAQVAMERVFQAGRAGAPEEKDKHSDAQAAALTQRCFTQIKQAGLKPPTHSASGMPKRDAQYGYAAMQQTLDAIEKKQPLPQLAQNVHNRLQQQRRLISGTPSPVNRGNPKNDNKKPASGPQRCRQCGRFISLNRGHTCPTSATGQSLQRSLARRLKVPPDKFDRGKLDAVIKEAREHGDALMTHGLTGEKVRVSLDGMAIALSTGYTPDAWKEEGKQQHEHPVTGQPVGAQQAGQPALAMANSAYGHQPQPEQSVTTSAEPPAAPVHEIKAGSSTVTVDHTSGTEYDTGRFIGTEYRKINGAWGEKVTAKGHTYTIGTRSASKDDWATARHEGLEGPPKPFSRGKKKPPPDAVGTIGVGRTLVGAVDILSSGKVATNTDGVVEVYDHKNELVSAYDPSTRTVGDFDGTPNASSPQMAAVLAHHLLNPQNDMDRAFVKDMQKVNDGNGSPLAAADGAYLVLRHNHFDKGQTLMAGAKVSASQCPKCGGLMGAAGCNCTPAIQPAPAPEPPAAEAAPPPPPPPPPAQPPNVTVNVDPGAMQPVADAFREGMKDVQVQHNVNVDPPQVNVEAPQVNATVEAKIDPNEMAKAMTSQMTDLKDAVKSMATAIEEMAKQKPVAHAPPPPPPPIDERAINAMDNLAGALNSRSPHEPMPAPAPAPAPPAEAAPAEAAPAEAKQDETISLTDVTTQTREPPPDDQMTPQEHILKHVRLPAADRFLNNVPPELGGHRTTPLPESIPQVDENYIVNKGSEKVLNAMSSMLQLGARSPERARQLRSFGIYGPPGTGKNTLARQFAASVQTVDDDGNVRQGMNYIEANITEETSINELIGTTTLESDGKGGTRSVATLGKLGTAAASGSVVCINEVVRNPKLLTKLQPMLEDGYIEVDSPEAGTVHIPVHPSTVFVMTWNPGLEGDQDRPSSAPLSRITPFKLDAPTEEERAARLDSFFDSFSDDKGKDKEQTSYDQNHDHAGILARDYKAPDDIRPSKDEVTATIRFTEELKGLVTRGGAGGVRIGMASRSPSFPGDREAARLLALGKTVGWDDAMETMKVYCDQNDEDYNEQWDLIKDAYNRHIGDALDDTGRSLKPRPEMA